ncbi:MAG: hypothetical protein M3R67_02105 [Acidobacteriota bacterium]|nr:hypothetical protein [Acidobacteriota bacterium]
MVYVTYAREPSAKQTVLWRFASDHVEALFATSEIFRRAGSSWPSDDHRGRRNDVPWRTAFSLFQRERLRAGNCFRGVSLQKPKSEQEELEEGTG